MGFFNTVAAWFSGKWPVAAAPPEPLVLPVSGTPIPTENALTVPENGSFVNVLYADDLPEPMPAPVLPLSPVDVEISEWLREYSFVLNSDPPQLRPDQLWWSQDSNTAVPRNGVALTYSWLLPFMAPEVAKNPMFNLAHGIGPGHAERMAIQLRAEIRPRRKLKTPHSELLAALFGIAVMQELFKDLSFKDVQTPYTSVSMAQFFSLDDLMDAKVSFQNIGYSHCRYLAKTDIKWLVEEFGEPSNHLSIKALFEPAWRNAVRRYCWFEIHKSGELTKADTSYQPAMRRWLTEQFKATIDERERQKRWVAFREEKAARALKLAEESTALLNSSFVVADVLPTGPNLDSDTLLEISALLIGPGGAVEAEFAEIIAVNRPLLRCVTELKCLTTAHLASAGLPLKEVLSRFSTFVGGHTLLIKDEPFVLGFLNKAMAECGVAFNVNVLDISPVPLFHWPAGLLPVSMPEYSRPVFSADLCNSLSAAGRELVERDTIRRQGRRFFPKLSLQINSQLLHWSPTGAFPINAVWTSYNETALKELANNKPGHGAYSLCTAILEIESGNIHDAIAIRVLVNNRTVGYLSREMSIAFRNYFSTHNLPLQSTTCDAIISGGLLTPETKYNYSVHLDLDLEASAPKSIAPTYHKIERRDPDPIFHKLADGSYLVEARILPNVLQDMDKHKRVFDWTTDHWDSFNYYLCNSQNLGLGHKLFGIKKTAVNRMFGGEFPSGTLEAIVGLNVLVSLRH